MERPILVPLDGSVLAEGALPFAEALARAAGAQLLLVRAAGGDDDQTPDTARSYVASLVTQLGARGIAAEMSVPRGDPAGAIVEEARLSDAALVVMGTHGRGGLGRWVYGSVAMRVLQSSPAPVLLVRSWEPAVALGLAKAHPRILVPLDGSALAEAALPVALRWAALLGGEVALLRAVPLPTAGAAGDLVLQSDLDRELAELRAEAADYLMRLVERLERAGIAVRREVRVGRAPDAIALAAREHEVALIVMTTHGRTGLARTIFGSVAETLVRASPVPLLLVRPQDVSAALPSPAPPVVPAGVCALTLDEAEAALVRIALQTLDQALATGAAGAGVQTATRRQIAALLARLAGGTGEDG